MTTKTISNYGTTASAPMPQYLSKKNQQPQTHTSLLPEILFITSYPPRECGIATYSQDLIKALHNKFNHSFQISICALETAKERHIYSEKIKYILNTDFVESFGKLANSINESSSISLVMLQHEFGFFDKKEGDLKRFMNALTKPVALVFHTVLPRPNDKLKVQVQEIVATAASVVVMTRSAADLLTADYGVPPAKITVIAHGTHLVAHGDKTLLKEKYALSKKTVLSTFGLLSSGKNIETTLDALPAIILKNPNIIFLIIGKTHPSVVAEEGEKYRKMLAEKVHDLQLKAHVKFINSFLPLPELLEYLQLTDVYLFTSKDPNQAVSGTFSYAMSCGCAIVSTPIPHALELLGNDSGAIIGFEKPQQLALTVNKLLANDDWRERITSNSLHTIVPTAWENSALAHVRLFEKVGFTSLLLRYRMPPINLNHFKKLTTAFGMIQFSIINQPDILSGYTLDDNARALVAMCQHYELTNDDEDLQYIELYLKFIKYCLQPNGNFLNYVDKNGAFTAQNNETNLEDSNGRAIWALGFLVSKGNILPPALVAVAELVLQKALVRVSAMHSTRAMAFVIKGLYYSNLFRPNTKNTAIITEFADRLVQMFRHEADKDWIWFEGYLTYANSILPEALLCAWLDTGQNVYQKIAKTSFDFLLTKTFNKTNLHVISNKGWSHRGKEDGEKVVGGEQPIDVAYSILALSKFYEVFQTQEYSQKMVIAFNWFLGNNHLHQIMYNPCTGGCYDGLESDYFNLNQGAESTVSYLMACLTMIKN